MTQPIPYTDLSVNLQLILYVTYQSASSQCLVPVFLFLCVLCGSNIKSQSAYILIAQHL